VVGASFVEGEKLDEANFIVSSPVDTLMESVDVADSEVAGAVVTEGPSGNDEPVGAWRRDEHVVVFLDRINKINRIS